jgi:hypothetical protein
MVITNDRLTWPTGDKLWQIAQAIAIAEGYNLPTSNPFRLNNPGDISDGYDEFGGEPHSGSDVTRFPDAQTGWQWLYNKLSRIAQGKSAVYSPQMTWAQLAQKWAGNWQNWVGNVTTELNVQPNSTIIQFLQGE